ncbi:MAG: hypothetical protein QOG80_2677 [Pseudonocardiales bacterium]|jgi:uncharacterized membrane protein|nr:hypothetical protein [Pseudonocardiales bacterium]
MDTTSSTQATNSIVAAIEAAKALDVVAEGIQRVLRPALGRPAVQRVLSGAPLGHRLHPALVAVPIGSWVAASMLDVTPGNRAAAQRLVGFGCLTALPAAAAGATDWLETTGPDRRTGLVHAALNDLALATYIASWRSRRRGHGVRGPVLALAGSGLLAAAGWLGGHLAYSRGVGVEVVPPAAG